MEGIALNDLEKCLEVEQSQARLVEGSESIGTEVALAVISMAKAKYKTLGEFLMSLT